MTTLIDKHMPVKELSAKEHKQKMQPWITPATVTKKTRKKNCTKSSWNRKRSVSIFSDEEWNHFPHSQKYKKNTAKIILTQTIKIWKRYGTALKKLSILSKSLHPLHLVSKTKIEILTDHKDIANHFNSYFSGIAANILKNRKYIG